MGVHYRREHTARELDPAGLRPPSLDWYYERLVGYALQTNRGEHPLPRPDAHPVQQHRVAVSGGPGSLED